jgi:cytoskeletal protein RodZ
MGLYLQQKNERSELQQRIAAELAEKAKKKANGQADKPDGVHDSAYLEKTKTTTSLAWVWVLIAVVFIGVLIWLVTLAI